MDKRQTILIVDDAEFNRDIKKVTPHSRYFSDELGVPNFSIKIQNWCLLYTEIYGININMEKDIFTIERKITFIW